MTDTDARKLADAQNPGAGPGEYAKQNLVDPPPRVRDILNAALPAHSASALPQPAQERTITVSEGHDKICPLCNKACDVLTGNPSLWPIMLPVEGQPAYHHMGCVAARVYPLPSQPAGDVPESERMDSARFEKADYGCIAENLYSDAMDAAVLLYCMKSREQAGKPGDGETIIRERLAAAITGHLYT